MCAMQLASAGIGQFKAQGNLPGVNPPTVKVQVDLN